MMNLSQLPQKMKKPSASDNRISNLSDDILHHILSFLPMLNSVATSILSTRFNHLWKHVPNLAFEDVPPPLFLRTNSTAARFADFVNMVFTLHASHALEKVCIRCHINSELYDVGRWVRDSVMRNVRSFDLYVVDDVHDRTAKAVRLPSDLFTCKTLEVVRLRGKILVSVPIVVCVPKLERMELVGVEYQDEEEGGRDCVGRLISSCSSLESIVVKDKEFVDDDYVEERIVDDYYVEERIVEDSVEVCAISSSTLKDVKFELFEKTSLIWYNPELFCCVLRRLNLKSSSRKKIRVPSNVYTCETLELLSLEGSFVISDAKTICLPNLTYLALLRVKYDDDEFLSVLVSSSTSLETLAIEKTIKADLKIFSWTVKVIEVNLCCCTRPAHKAVINAPAMECLKLKSSGWVDYDFQDVASLEQGDVNFVFHGISHDRRYSDHCYRVFTYVYQTLRHAKRLKIYHYTKYGYFERHVPMFNRLTELDVTIDGDQIGLLQNFIENSTKLENLTVSVLNKDDSPYCYHWKNPDSVPACLLSSLRTVSIISFKGRENELAMAKYFLQEARIMENMKVCFSLYFYSNSKIARRSFGDVFMAIDRRKDAMKEVSNEILDFPRGSKKCAVLFKDEGVLLK